MARQAQLVELAVPVALMAAAVVVVEQALQLAVTVVLVELAL